MTRHVADVVQQQVDAGIDVVGDGEYKPSSMQYLAARLAGSRRGCLRVGLRVPTGPIGIGGRDATMFPDYYGERAGNPLPEGGA